ncbi:MAG: carboxypeptidase regulatory-like domain-containing protein [Myxococcota bacterium]
MTHVRRRLLWFFAALTIVVGALVLWPTKKAPGDGDAREASAVREAGVGLVGDKASTTAPTALGSVELGGSISGRITSETGAGIAGADVCARVMAGDLAEADRRMPSCTKSGPDGAYQLSKLFRVKYTVSAAARGYIPKTHRGDDDDFRGVRLDRTEDVGDVDLVLEEGGAELKGVVKDLGGGVIEGAFVSASAGRWSVRQATGAIARTDEQGQFVLWVEEGARNVLAQAEGYAMGQEFGIAPGQFFTLVLTPESVIAGTVLDEKGQPVAGAHVSSNRGWWGGDIAAISDERGHYRIDGLEAGRYKPAATAPGASGQARESVRLGIGETKDAVDVYLYAEARVFVSVVDEDGTPCEAGNVSFSERKTKHRAGGDVEDGALEIDAMRSGRYRVTVRCKGFASKDEYPDLEVADEDVRASYAVIRGSVLRGVTVGAQGDAIRASVVASLEGGAGGDADSAWAESGAENGEFVLEGLKPGTYKVKAWAQDIPEPDEPTTVEVPERGEAAPIRIEFGEAGGVRGRVTNDAGEPVARASIQARGAGWNSTQVRDDGTYELEGVAPGEYRVIARGARWSDTLRSPGTTDDDIQGEKVTVVAGEVAEVDLVVESRDGTIEGIVVDEAGGPLADAYISVSRQSDSVTAGAGNARRQTRWSWGTDPVITDVDGQFTVKRLADGKYTIRAHRKGGGEGFVEDVAVGETNVQVQMQVEGSMAGTVDSGGAPLDHMTVTVVDESASFRRSETFQRTEGAWIMRDLPAGTFTVNVDADSGTAERKNVVLKAGEELEGVDLVLEGRTTVTGRVVMLGTGDPVPGMTVKASTGSSRGFMMFGDKPGKETTGEDGRYTVENAPAGKLTLNAHPSDMNSWDEYNWASLLVVAKAGETLEAPDIVLIPKRVKGDDPKGDLGYKINEIDLGDETDNPPKVVGFVRPGGPAETAGLEVGDVIVKVDGHDITGDQPGMYRTLLVVPPGDKVELALASGDAVTIVAGKPV